MQASVLYKDAVECRTGRFHEARIRGVEFNCWNLNIIVHMQVKSADFVKIHGKCKIQANKHTHALHVHVQ